jgi:hypothetical protein
VVRILDTLHLEDVYVSTALLTELSARGVVDIVGAEGDLFDERGNLSPF